MQTITWSPNLIHAVRQLKKLDLHTVASNFNERKAMDSFQLTNTEEQAVKSILIQNSGSVSVKNWW
jgi:hypothetical protein